MHIFMKSHITAQSGPVIYSFYAVVCVCVAIPRLKPGQLSGGLGSFYQFNITGPDYTCVMAVHNSTRFLCVAHSVAIGTNLADM